MGIRLGYHFHVPAVLRDGIIYMPGYQTVFIDSLAPYCDRILCFLHTPREEEAYQCSSAVQSPNVELVNIGPHASVPQRMLWSKMYVRHLGQRRMDLDAILLRGTSPLLPAMAGCVPDLPKILFLVASYVDGVDALPQPRWRKELIRLWSYWNEHEQLKIAKNNLTIVNSALLYENLKPYVPNLIETRTTTILKKDIFLREDTCLETPLHILFSGRITYEKGILDILDALAMLSARKIDYIFEVVGMPESETFLLEFWKYAEKLNIKQHIQYHGFKKVGEELFGFYKQADIHIIASQAAEGFPRTIWEAFSQGTTVIATNVGSIPHYLRHEQDALIVPPKSPAALAQQIQRLLHDPELRRRLIANGYKLAEENTLDRRAKEMISEIEKWVDSRKRLDKAE